MTRSDDVLAREDAALRRLLVDGARPGAAHAYGSHPDQVYETFEPGGDFGETGSADGTVGDANGGTTTGPATDTATDGAPSAAGGEPGGGPARFPARTPTAPTVVVVHGGYFRARTDRTHARPFARALAEQGLRVVLAEYRRVPGDPGASLADLRDLDLHLRSTLPRPPRAWAGHSAGGTFVLLRALGGLDAPGVTLPSVDVVALAPLSDLTLDARRSGADSAVAEWVGGGPDDRPDAYARVDPALLLAAGARPGGRLTVVHGEDDRVVPVGDSRRAWPPGTDVRLLPGAHHFDVVDPASPHVEAVYAALS